MILDIVRLYQWVQRENTFKLKGLLTAKEAGDGDDKEESIFIDQNQGVGIKSMLGGSIVKQVVKYDVSDGDTGYRTNIFVRWDLLCQIINHSGLG